GRDPGVPDRVHIVEAGHVGEPDVGGEELRLVGAGLRQQAVDAGEDLLRLLRDGGHRVLRHLAGEVDGVAVDDGLAHAWSGLDAGGAHAWDSFWFMAGLRGRPEAADYGRSGSGG